MVTKALNIASQCRATGSHELTKKILVDGGNGLMSELLIDAAEAIEALAQPPEPRNFCPRCGKRTADLTVIHTCTPPEGGHQ